MKSLPEPGRRAVLPHANVLSRLACVHQTDVLLVRRWENGNIVREIASLLPEAQKQVIDFVAFLGASAFRLEESA